MTLRWRSQLRLSIALTAKKAWPGMERDIKYFVDHGKGKKIYFSEVRRTAAPFVVLVES